MFDGFKLYFWKDVQKDKEDHNTENQMSKWKCTNTNMKTNSPTSLPPPNLIKPHPNNTKLCFKMLFTSLFPINYYFSCHRSQFTSSTQLSLRWNWKPFRSVFRTTMSWYEPTPTQNICATTKLRYIIKTNKTTLEPSNPPHQPKKKTTKTRQTKKELKQHQPKKRVRLTKKDTGSNKKKQNWGDWWNQLHLTRNGQQ